MGLKKKGKGPFKGWTPKGVFQTIDFGAGQGIYLYHMAKKNPKRTYLAVDFKINPKGLPKNLKYSKEDALKKLQRLALQGKKARHIQIAMPAGKLTHVDYLKKIAHSGKKVLIPNGKIYLILPYFSLATPESIFNVIDGFIEEGYSFRNIKLYHNLLKQQKKSNTSQKKIKEYIYRAISKYSPKASEYWEHYGEIPLHLEFTYRLKKVFPKKEERKKWPNS